MDFLSLKGRLCNDQTSQATRAGALWMPQTLLMTFPQNFLRGLAQVPRKSESGNSAKGSYRSLNCVGSALCCNEKLLRFYKEIQRSASLCRRAIVRAYDSVGFVEGGIMSRDKLWVF